MGLCLAGFAVVLAWWLSLTPSDERDWQKNVEQTAWRISPAITSPFTIAQLRLPHRNRLSAALDQKLRSIADPRHRYLPHFWGSPWIAHPILSFQFADGQHVASRWKRGWWSARNTRPSALLSQYELTYIVADERDVIRLRTNYRTGEEVYLYHATATPEPPAPSSGLPAQRESLHEQAQFYNAVTSNCTTNIRLHTAAASRSLPPWIGACCSMASPTNSPINMAGSHRRVDLRGAESPGAYQRRARAADQSPDFSHGLRWAGGFRRAIDDQIITHSGGCS